MKSFQDFTEIALGDKKQARDPKKSKMAQISVQNTSVVVCEYIDPHFGSFNILL